MLTLTEHLVVAPVLSQVWRMSCQWHLSLCSLLSVLFFFRELWLAEHHTQIYIPFKVYCPVGSHAVRTLRNSDAAEPNQLVIRQMTSCTARCSQTVRAIQGCVCQTSNAFRLPRGKTPIIAIVYVYV